jgi:WD40 repeat protein
LGSASHNDPTVKVWDVATGGLLQTLPGHESKFLVQAIAWSRDGTSILTIDEKTLRRWNISKGSLEKSAVTETNYNPTAIYTMDGASILTTGGGLRRLNSRTLEPEAASFGDTIVNEIVKGLDQRSDKTLIASRSPATLFSLVVSTGDVAQIFKDDQRVWNYLSASKSGERIVAGNGESLFLLDLAKGPNLRTLRSNLKDGHALAVSQDGRLIAVQNDKSILLIHANSGEVVQQLQGYGYIGTYKLVFSPDRERLVSDDYQALRIWEVPTGSSTVVAKHETYSRHGESHELTFAPDGRSFIATGTDLSSYAIDHWSTDGARLIRRLILPGYKGRWEFVHQFRPEGLHHGSHLICDTLQHRSVQHGLMDPLQFRWHN